MKMQRGKALSKLLYLLILFTFTTPDLWQHTLMQRPTMPMSSALSQLSGLDDVNPRISSSLRSAAIVCIHNSMTATIYSALDAVTWAPPVGLVLCCWAAMKPLSSVSSISLVRIGLISFPSTQNSSRGALKVLIWNSAVLSAELSRSFALLTKFKGVVKRDGVCLAVTVTLVSLYHLRPIRACVCALRGRYAPYCITFILLKNLYDTSDTAAEKRMLRLTFSRIT